MCIAGMLLRFTPGADLRAFDPSLFVSSTRFPNFCSPVLDDVMYAFVHG